MNATLPPLLALAQGRRVRLRKAPTPRPREIGLHIAVAAILRTYCLPDWTWFHVPNGEVRDKRLAAKLKAMGAKLGIPDFVLLSPYNSVRFLELKRNGESLSEAQEGHDSEPFENVDYEAPGNSAIPPPPDRGQLLLSAWLKRDVPPRDDLLGGVMCTTPRWLIFGETGIGKTFSQWIWAPRLPPR
jgi:hypothetical protein